MGTILGGSSIVCPKGGVNCYLSMREKNEQWLKFKTSELDGLCTSNPYTIEKTNRWHSICFPLFSEYKDLFYKNNKRNLKSQILDSLNDVAFTVWFGDCGDFYRGKITLNTNIWGQDGNNKIQKYFKIIGYKSEIVYNRGKLRIRLDESSSSKFVKLIEPHLPSWVFFR